MIYKGKKIKDREYVGKSQLIESLPDNRQDFTLDDIEDWLEEKYQESNYIDHRLQDSPELQTLSCNF